MTIKPATNRFLLAVGLVGVALLSQGPIVFGQGSAGDCGDFSLEHLLKYPRPGVIFRGTVTESRSVTADPTERNAGLDGFLVTFRVDRAWKGTVYREMVIYQVMTYQKSMYAPGTAVSDRMAPRPYPNAVPFEVGKEYFVSTEPRDPLDPRDLERFKADGFVFGSARDCVTRLIDSTTEKALSGAPGEPPLEQR